MSTRIIDNNEEERRMNINKSSNEIWKAWQNYSGFENRSFRFTEDMRPLFYKWLGITSDSYVLDAGCGTGVFARYLAADIIGGRIDGFDINQGFIEYGNKKLKELNLTEKVTLRLDDGFNLSISDNPPFFKYSISYPSFPQSKTNTRSILRIERVFVFVNMMFLLCPATQ